VAELPGVKVRGPLPLPLHVDEVLRMGRMSDGNPLGIITTISQSTANVVPAVLCTIKECTHIYWNAGTGYRIG
jgi:hypothetical protein